MSVFLHGQIPRISPNIRFLEGINLIEAGDQDITEALRGQLEGTSYSISINSHYRISYQPPAERGLQETFFIGREITLRWGWGCFSEFFSIIPKFLSGICYPMNEQNFSNCNQQLLERAFTRIAPNTLGETTNQDQEEAQRELQKAYNQGVRIIFIIADSRRYFKSEIIHTWPCSAFKVGYYLTQKVPFIRDEEPFTLFELNNKITSILNAGKELISLYTHPTRALTIEQQEIRTKQAERVEDLFFEHLTTTFSNFGQEWIEEFKDLKERSEDSTFMQYTIDRLNLVGIALQVYLYQRELSNENTPENIAHYWAQMDRVIP